MPTINLVRSQVKKQNKNRENRQKLYQSAAWKKLRQSKLMTNPLCELCTKEGKVVPAIDVHHIYSPFDFPNKGYELDVDNLISLCKEHHSKLHANHQESTLYQIYLERKRLKMINNSENQ